MAWGTSRGQVSNTAGAIYTVPSSKTSKVKTIVFFNGNTTTEVVKVYLVPNSGGSVGTKADADQILNLSLTSGNTFEFSPAFPLEGLATNDTIQAESTTASKVNYWVEAVEQDV